MDRAVLDASVVVDLVVAPTSAELLRRIVGAADLVAPALLDAEVLCALRRQVRRGELTEAHGRLGAVALGELPVDRMATDRFAIAVWDLRENLTAYDATYVALARSLECPLLTADERLAASPVLEPGEVVLVGRS